MAGGASLSQAARLPSLRLSKRRSRRIARNAAPSDASSPAGPAWSAWRRNSQRRFRRRAWRLRRATRCTDRWKRRPRSAPWRKREIDVLIGTQIVAKGHHFPQLTLVGVIDADLGGSDGDLRARERTFQLLHQVSGRAGRAEKPGLVLIQTRNPDDAVMKALASRRPRRVLRAGARLPRTRACAAVRAAGRDHSFGRMTAIRCATSGRELAKSRAGRARREGVGADARLLSAAARAHARAASGAGRDAMSISRPICAPGSRA